MLVLFDDRRPRAAIMRVVLPMLVRQGEARTDRIDRHLACTLAAIAGALNTAAFQAVGFFAANMTGNVSLISDRTAFGAFATAGFYLSIVLAFIAGATVSTLLISSGRRRRLHGIYALSILTEAVLMALLGAVDLLLAPLWRGQMLVLGLSFLMGLQNAVVTRISNARVRTTHVSGMTTDLGIELGLLLDTLCGRETGVERSIILTNLRLHAATVLSFLGGGVIGVLVYRQIGTQLLFGCSALLLLIAVPQAFKARDLGRQPPSVRLADRS